MGHHPTAHGLVVARQLQLRDGSAPIRLGPERLVGMGDSHAHDHGLAAAGGSGRRARPAVAGLPAWRRRRRWPGSRRHLRLDLAGRFVRAQSFEGCLAYHSCSCPSRELDLGHQLGLHPMHRGFRARRPGPGEGILLGGEGFQAREKGPRRVLAESRSHPSEVHQMRAAVNPHEQGAQMALIARPTADDHLVTRAAFGLGPAVAAARAVGGVELLRDNSFQGHAAGQFEHGVATRLHMLDEADQLPLGLAELLQHPLQPRLALAERQLAQILPPLEQQVEGEEDQILGLLLGQRRLESGEIGRALARPGQRPRRR